MNDLIKVTFAMAMFVALPACEAGGLSAKEKADHRTIVAAQFCMQDCSSAYSSAISKYCGGGPTADGNCVSAAEMVDHACQTGCASIPPAKFKPEYDHPEKLGR